jgi:Tfp pilus assembly protein PilW
MSFRHGFGLVEALLALAITSVLLVAVGAAFQSGFKNYKQNQNLVDSQNGARLLMHRIMTQARQSTFLNVTADGLTIAIETSADNFQYLYTYLPANHQVMLGRMDLATNVTTNLGTVDNVTNFSIPLAQRMNDPPRLTLTMTVSYGGNDAVLSASAVPRSTIAF